MSDLDQFLGDLSKKESPISKFEEFFKNKELVGFSKILKEFLSPYSEQIISNYQDGKPFWSFIEASLEDDSLDPLRIRNFLSELSDKLSILVRTDVSVYEYFYESLLPFFKDKPMSFMTAMGRVIPVGRDAFVDFKKSFGDDIFDSENFYSEPIAVSRFNTYFKYSSCYRSYGFLEGLDAKELWKSFSTKGSTIEADLNSALTELKGFYSKVKDTESKIPAYNHLYKAQINIKLQKDLLEEWLENSIWDCSFPVKKSIPCISSVGGPIIDRTQNCDFFKYSIDGREVTNLSKKEKFAADTGIDKNFIGSLDNPRNDLSGCLKMMSSLLAEIDEFIKLNNDFSQEESEVVFGYNKSDYIYDVIGGSEFCQEAKLLLHKVTVYLGSDLSYETYRNFKSKSESAGELGIKEQFKIIIDSFGLDYSQVINTAKVEGVYKSSKTNAWHSVVEVCFFTLFKDRPIELAKFLGVTDAKGVVDLLIEIYSHENLFNPEYLFSIDGIDFDSLEDGIFLDILRRSFNDNFGCAHEIVDFSPEEIKKLLDSRGVNILCDDSFTESIKKYFFPLLSKWITNLSTSECPSVIYNIEHVEGIFQEIYLILYESLKSESFRPHFLHRPTDGVDREKFNNTPLISIFDEKCESFSEKFGEAKSVWRSKFLPSDLGENKDLIKKWYEVGTLHSQEESKVLSFVETLLTGKLTSIDVELLLPIVVEGELNSFLDNESKNYFHLDKVWFLSPYQDAFWKEFIKQVSAFDDPTKLKVFFYTADLLKEYDFNFLYSGKEYKGFPQFNKKDTESWLGYEVAPGFGGRYPLSSLSNDELKHHTESFRCSYWTVSLSDENIRLWHNLIRNFPKSCSKDYNIILIWLNFVKYNNDNWMEPREYSFGSLAPISEDFLRTFPKSYSSKGSISNIDASDDSYKCWVWMRNEDLGMLDPKTRDMIKNSYLLMKKYGIGKSFKQLLLSFRDCRKPSVTESLNGFRIEDESLSVIDYFEDRDEASEIRVNDIKSYNDNTWDRLTYKIIRDTISGDGREKYDELPDDLHSNERELLYLKELQKAFAEFLLSRIKPLKGRRGSKSNLLKNDDFYEKDPIWRRFYLMALTELKLDLGGKVHKTVNILKNFDASDEVRSAAKIAYKAVRNKDTSNRSERDWRRGLNAAFYYLCLAQRLTLEGDVDFQNAKIVHRKLLS